jgi:hypothetical protein
MSASQFEQINDHIYRSAGNYSRMGKVLSYVTPWWCVQDGPLSFEEGLRLLGEHWSCSDNIREYIPALRKLLGTYGPLRAMMNSEENAAYDALPDTVTVYRGCDASVLTGASWSLDQNVANSFPFLNRYEVPSPMVVKARVKKNRILALKLGRDESEIITFSARRIGVQPADIAIHLQFRKESSMSTATDNPTPTVTLTPEQATAALEAGYAQHQASDPLAHLAADLIDAGKTTFADARAALDEYNSVSPQQ